MFSLVAKAIRFMHSRESRALGKGRNAGENDMRIRILSDLHLEMGEWTPPALPADVVVLAGDIHVGTRGIDWAARCWPDTPVTLREVAPRRPTMATSAIQTPILRTISRMAGQARRANSRRTEGSRERSGAGRAIVAAGAAFSSFS